MYDTHAQGKKLTKGKESYDSGQMLDLEENISK